jgi:hypothetical protein
MSLGYFIINKGQTIPPYKRPSDWLILPNVILGEQKLVGLVAVFEEENSNLFSIRCEGNFTVKVYGLNNVLVSTANFATSVKGELNLSYSNFIGTESTNGYRQAIIEITPQSGVNLTSIQLHERHSLGGNNSYTTNWLDMIVSGESIQTFRLRGLSNATDITGIRLLEQFEWVGPSAITDFTTLFNGAVSLQKVTGRIWTSNGELFTGMFRQCRKLTSVPLLDTSNGTAFNSMFFATHALKKLPILNTSKGTTFNNMLGGSIGLEEVPLFDTSNGTVFSSMFTNAYYLKTVPLFDTSKGQTFLNMFLSCTALKSVPHFNTSQGTNFGSMFYFAKRISTIPPFNTENGESFSSMFQECDTIEIVPTLNTSKVLNAASWGTNVFLSCFSLSKSSMTTYKFSTNFVNCFLGKDEIVEIFNNLITTIGQSINITGNKGASLLTVADRAIATNKGWTITG